MDQLQRLGLKLAAASYIILSWFDFGQFGLRCCVALRLVLGLGSVQYLQGLSRAQLAKLVYRDNIDVKHYRRDRLREELRQKQELEQDYTRDKVLAVRAGFPRSESTPLAELVVQHLMEAMPMHGIVCQSLFRTTGCFYI